MHINENAFIARRARSLATGRVVTVHHGHNTSTGEDIIWIKVDGQRLTRVTSPKKIAAVYAEIDGAIAAGEAVAVSP